MAGLEVFDDGSGPALYVGGFFASAGGVTASNVAKWNGNTWSALGLGLTATPSGTASVSSFAVFDDGTGPALYVGGLFSQAGATSVSNLARWDGTTWSDVGGGVSVSVYAAWVSAMAVFDDGSGPALFVGGLFSSAGGVLAQNVAKWGGISWTSLGSGLSPSPSSTPQSPGAFAMAVFDDGTGPALHIGGRFALAGTVPVSNLARWDGSTWSDVGGGVGSYTQPATVSSFTVFDDGQGPALFVGGSFLNAGGLLSVGSIARWDGSSWSSPGGGIGISSYPGVIGDIAVFDDSTTPALYATGRFTTAGGLPASSIARWDGSSWTALGQGLTNPNPAGGNALEVFNDGSGPGLYAGGWFGNAGATAVGNVARWSCGSTISVSLTQPGGPGPGSPVFLANTNLTPGHAYYNIFSFDLCPGGVGTGLFGGLCVTSPANLQFVLDQLLAPLGTSPIHFTASSSYVTAGPFTLPPLTVEAITIDFTGGALGPISQVATIAVQ